MSENQPKVENTGNSDSEVLAKARVKFTLAGQTLVWEEPSRRVRRELLSITIQATRMGDDPRVINLMADAIAQHCPIVRQLIQAGRLDMDNAEALEIVRIFKAVNESFLLKAAQEIRAVGDEFGGLAPLSEDSEQTDTPKAG